LQETHENIFINNLTKSFIYTLYYNYNIIFFQKGEGKVRKRGERKHGCKKEGSKKGSSKKGSSKKNKEEVNLY
jgi:hypothetical protein